MSERISLFLLVCAECEVNDKVAGDFAQTRQFLKKFQKE